MRWAGNIARIAGKKKINFMNEGDHLGDLGVDGSII
jgi:hypothetical protein